MILSLNLAWLFITSGCQYADALFVPEVQVTKAIYPDEDDVNGVQIWRYAEAALEQELHLAELALTRSAWGELRHMVGKHVSTYQQLQTRLRRMGTSSETAPSPLIDDLMRQTRRMSSTLQTHQAQDFDRTYLMVSGILHGRVSRMLTATRIRQLSDPDRQHVLHELSMTLRAHEHETESIRLRHFPPDF